MQIETLTLGPLDTNTYIIVLDELIVIDPADDADKIKQAAAKIGKPIKHVLLTHGHFDHCNAAYELQRDGAKVYMSKADFEMIKNDLDLAKFCGVTFNKFEPDYLIGECELDLCGQKIEVLSTPGHTEGGLTYIVCNDIFCGDTLFYMSVGRSDLPTGNKRILTQSVNRLCALDGDYIVHPGHGRSTTLNFERKYNPYVKA